MTDHSTNIAAHSKYNLSQVLEEVNSINFTGNIIPHTWYARIKLLPTERAVQESKRTGEEIELKADLIAIVILSEIIYWYRPYVIRDEQTGKEVDLKKKFKSDMLQRSIQSFADQFGISKRQVSDALKRLEQQGLIFKEIRTIQTSQGRLNNVLYVAPIVENIKELNEVSSGQVNGSSSRAIQQLTPGQENVSQNVSPATFKRTTYYDRTYHLPHLNVPPGTIERSTYTENTTEITTKNTSANIREKCGQYVTTKNTDNKNAADDINKIKSNNLLANELTIGVGLTESQYSRVYELAKAHRLQFQTISDDQLVKAIEYCLLDSEQYTQAGKDFNKKFNTIKKQMAQGKWIPSPDLFVSEKKQTQRQNTQLIVKLREANGDVSYWMSRLESLSQLEKPDEYHRIKNDILPKAQMKYEALRQQYQLLNQQSKDGEH